jgi:plasmid stability protein
MTTIPAHIEPRRTSSWAAAHRQDPRPAPSAGTRFLLEFWRKFQQKPGSCWAQPGRKDGWHCPMWTRRIRARGGRASSPRPDGPRPGCGRPHPRRRTASLGNARRGVGQTVHCEQCWPPLAEAARADAAVGVGPVSPEVQVRASPAVQVPVSSEVQVLDRPSDGEQFGDRARRHQISVRVQRWYHHRYLGGMAMTLRLTPEETEALRLRAHRERRSMQDVARQAIREYVEEHSRAELLDQVLDEEIPRYAEALRRLGVCSTSASTRCSWSPHGCSAERSRSGTRVCSSPP